MENEKQPGILCGGIILLGLTFEFHEGFKSEEESITYKMSAEYEPTFSDDNTILNARLKFKLASEPLDIEMLLVGIYRQSKSPNMTLEQFAGHHAPAQLIPYVREIIANITSRSPFTTLVIPPINVFDFISKTPGKGAPASSKELKSKKEVPKKMPKAQPEPPAQ